MKPSRLTFLSLALALAFLPAISPAAAKSVASSSAAASGLKLIRIVEGVSEYELSNGLKVLLVPDASKPITTVNITYRVGSRHENYGETGMAHLLEHLMFKGSKAHPRLWEEMSQRGVQFNGTTWLDRTNYYETFAAKPETLEWAISMEADRMVNSRISGDDLKTEFSVVRNEMEKNENSAARILIQRILSAAYQWHNYGKDTIGARTDVENVSIPRLQDFWRKYYQPDNAVLVVAGSFDAAQTLKLIEKKFGVIPRPKRVLENTYTLDPVQDGERSVVVRRVGDTQFVGAAYHTVPAAHPDYAAFEALSVILGDTPNGRLYKSLVESKLGTGIFAWAANLEEPGFILFGVELRGEQNRAAFVEDNNIVMAKKVLIDTIEDLASNPISDEELARAKAKIDSDMNKVFNSPEQLGVALSDHIGNGDWRLLFLLRDRVKALSKADVQRVAQTWLKASNRTTGEFIPEADPQRAPVAAKVDMAEQIKQFKPGVALAAGERFDASPENIDQRTHSGQFANGMKYAFLSKSTRGNTVSASLSFNMGNEKNLQGKVIAAALTADMLNRGTKKLTGKQFSEQLNKLQAKLQIGGDVDRVAVYLETTKGNLAKVLDLVNDALREPAFDEKEFILLINQELARLESALKEPQMVASNLLKSKLNTWPAGDPRAYIETEQQIIQIKAIKLDELKSFWGAFYGAEHAEVAVVGDFDEAAVKAQLAKQYGSWNAQQGYARLVRPFQANKSLDIKQQTPDKANAFFIGRIALPVGEQHADYPALAFANYLLGGSMNSRILERIRQKDGISYGGGSSVQVSSQDESGHFITYAIYAPENRARLEAGIREEIERVRKDGFTEAEIKPGKESFVQQMQLSRTQDSSLAAMLASNLHLGRTMQFSADFEARLKALSPEQIKAVMVKYIDPAQLSVVYAGNFDKK
ncbi:M16 family metallopeptidase [Iodobacter ciconiae]|uniref:Insulinase family protein n=1 Tax=Iodobacter ciconiae TaxID=2496266 RepID=A0A3S8ZNR3_9NEIS|nr:pitrilysin family protein [Iodobacter ciconiae]AZN35080.1 insulinase family protein [Iodobacter ciconiae]